MILVTTAGGFYCCKLIIYVYCFFCDNMVEEGGVYILLANLFLDNFIINFVWRDGATVTREPLQTERVHARVTVCMVCMHAHKPET